MMMDAEGDYTIQKGDEQKMLSRYWWKMMEEATGGLRIDWSGITQRSKIDIFCCIILVEFTRIFTSSKFKLFLYSTPHHQKLRQCAPDVLPPIIL